MIGQTARQPVTKGQTITTAIISGTAGSILDITVPAGKIGMAVQVDQVSGRGHPHRGPRGPRRRLLVAITGDKFPVVSVNARTTSP